MTSESRLYTFPVEETNKTKEGGKLEKFRLTTSTAKAADLKFQAVIYVIDKKTLVIRQEEGDKVYKSLEQLGDALPDNVPRFVLMSYPFTKESGRLSVPYVMLYYMPPTCSAELMMVYAGARELMRQTAQVGQVLEIKTTDDLENVPQLLGAV